MSQDFSKRFYTDFYDSVNQRSWLTEYLPGHYKVEDVHKIFLGRLRLDILLAETLILTDSQILDGAFFVQSDPINFLKLLVRSEEESLPIEIRSRKCELEDSFLSFVKKRNEEFLVPFSFSCIGDDTLRREIQKCLEETKSDRVNSWEDILEIIKHNFPGCEGLDILDNGLNQWFEAQNNPLLSGKILEWDNKSPLERCLNTSEIIELMDTEVGREEAEWVMDNQARSLIDRRLTRRIVEEVNGPVKDDLQKLKSAYNYAYNLSIALQHRCRTFESVSGSNKNRLAGLQVIDNETDRVAEFNSSTNIVLGLGEMPIDQFQCLFKENKNNFYEWWNTSNPESLERGMTPYLEAIDKIELSPELVHEFASALSTISGSTVTQPSSTIAFRANCTFYLIDEIVGRPLDSNENKMMNRIINYEKLIPVV